MGRLIDADEAIKEINQIELNHPYDDKEDILEKAISIVDHAPTVDAVPVVHGRWINSYPDIEPNPMFMYGICSVCGFEQSISSKLKFCPDCGAKMDKGE